MLASSSACTGRDETSSNTSVGDGLDGNENETTADDEASDGGGDGDGDGSGDGDGDGDGEGDGDGDDSGDSGGSGWNVTQFAPTRSEPGTWWSDSSTIVTESDVTLSGSRSSEK